MKINFTKEHFIRMNDLLMEMLLNNGTINNSIGQPLNVVELLHTTTVNSLNRIRLYVATQIKNLENEDEWVATSETQNRLDTLKKDKELLNLIIGYKRFRAELAENEAKKDKLKAKIEQMEEEAKTPEEKLKEAKAKLAELESPNF